MAFLHCNTLRMSDETQDNNLCDIRVISQSKGFSFRCYSMFTRVFLKKKMCFIQAPSSSSVPLRISYILY